MNLDKEIELLLKAHRPERVLELLLNHEKKSSLTGSLLLQKAKALHVLAHLEEAHTAVANALTSLPKNSDLALRAETLQLILKANLEMEVDSALRKLKNLENRSKNQKLSARSKRDIQEAYFKLFGLGLAFGVKKKSEVLRAFSLRKGFRAKVGEEVLAHLGHALGGEFSSQAKDCLLAAHHKRKGLERAEAALRLARYYLSSEISADSQPEIAAECAVFVEEALSIYRSESCRFGVVEAQVLDALARAKCGGEARSSLVHALKDSEAIGYWGGVYECSSALADYFHSCGKINEAYHYRSRALTVSQKMGFVAGIAFARLSLASLAQQRDLLQVAWNEYRELLTLAQKPAIKVLMGPGIAQGIASLPGKLDMATELVAESVRLQQQLDRDSRQSCAILGVLQMQQLRWADAAKTWENLAELDRKQKDFLSSLEHQAFSAQSMFMSLTAAGGLPTNPEAMSARGTLSQLQDQALRSQNPRAPLVRASILQVEGQLAIASDDLVVALKTFGEALQIYDKLQLPVQAAHTSTLVGLTCQAMDKKGLSGMAEESVWHFSNAAATFEKVGLLALARHARSLIPDKVSIKNPEGSARKAAVASARVIVH